MTRPPPWTTGLVVLTLSLSLSGCAAGKAALLGLFGVGHVRTPEARAAYNADATETEVSSSDRLYARAKQAIAARDYAGALQLLQLARKGAPGDARVLNAMGVIYDKLGRFDLSARYYGLAAVVAPNSEVVTANIHYSAALQARSLSVVPPVEVAVAVTPASPPAPTATAPPPAMVAVAKPALTPRRSGPLLIGTALVVIDASGRGLASETRAYLVARGWSVAVPVEPVARQARSEIRFRAEAGPMAQALARTLPFVVAMAPCIEACPFELVIGEGSPLHLRAANKGSRS